jgi:hypothetical protein
MSCHAVGALLFGGLPVFAVSTNTFVTMNFNSSRSNIHLTKDGGRHTQPGAIKRKIPPRGSALIKGARGRKSIYILYNGTSQCHNQL